MICSVWIKKVKELKKFPVLFVDEDNIQRVNEETQVYIFNRLGTKGSCSTAPDKYICTVCNSVYKRQKNPEKHRIGYEKEKG